VNEQQVAVLQVATRLNVGGVAASVASLARGLPEHGVHVQVAAGDIEPGEAEHALARQPTTLRLPLRRSLSLRLDTATFLALRRTIVRGRFAIVHTHMSKAGALGRLAARSIRGRPVVVHSFHGHLLEGYFEPIGRTGLLAAERMLARVADALVAVSPEVRDALLERGVGNPNQWRVIRIGVELERFLALEPGVDLQARRVLGIPAEALVIGAVGRLVSVKGLDVLLRAFAQLASASETSRWGHRPVLLAFAGDGEERTRLAALAQSLGVAKHVRFLGWVEDLARVIGAFDVVASSSRNEGTPVALVEAAAAARPLVAVDVGGIRQLVDHGRSGLLVPARDPSALAAALTTALADEGVRRAMGEAGRALARDRFGETRFIKEVAALYEELLATRRGVRPIMAGSGSPAENPRHRD
jgi:glycosyltransferase involved in cell wall biosynthesis